MAAPKKALSRDEVEELQEQLVDYQGDESEQGRREYARLKAKLRRLSHEETCTQCASIRAAGGNPITAIDVPLDTCGKKFRINQTDYFGSVTLPACEASTILHMIDQNRQEQLRHTQEGGRTVFLGQIGDRARTVQE